MTMTNRTDSTARKKKQHVLDEQGTSYELGPKLAEGGQGLVLRIAGDPRRLIKVSLWPDSDKRTQLWRNRIEAVRRMPILENRLPVAMPQALIVKPRAGYVMELMDGLIPLGELLKQSQEAFISGEGLAGYISSGGLGRRLRLLARLARVLAQLHGLAIAHGDLSPSNIFVSSSPEHAQVWLIDCDNLTYAVRDSNLAAYTRDYAAPEIMRHDAGISTYTDIWSFAVIAFQLLTMLHPFTSGTRVYDDGDLEAPALRGELPWVDHPEDDSNRATSGMGRSLVSTPALQSLFDRCFREGLQRREARPVMAEWAEVLEAAAARQVTCSEPTGGCGGTFLWNDKLECPFCETVHSDDTVLRMKHYLFAPLSDLGEDATPSDCWLPTSHEQLVSTQLTEIRSSPPGSATYLESAVVASVWIDGDKLVIRPSADRELWILHQGSKKLLPVERRLALKRQHVMHSLLLGRCDRTHGAWNFQW